jgi:uncharacterized protein (TIGR03437 family)
VNAASLLDGPVSAGETVVIRGAGFGSDAQVSMGGITVPLLSVTPTAITATVPAAVPSVAADLVVRSGGTASNHLLIPVAVTSPGLFAANGLGYGQGYILNKDGTLNSTSNPAAPGDRITVYATGVGPVSFTNGYAVTQYPVELYIDTFYCNGVAAVMGPVAGYLGDVLQLTVFVPVPVALNPDLVNFKFPPLSQVILKIKGAASQNGVAIAIAP